MKKSILIFASLFVILRVLSQAPEKMSYQAVIRNNSNALMTNQLIGMKVSILQNSPNGTEVYVETHNSITNENGLVSLEIGGGSVVSGNFSLIDWANGPFYVKTETDPIGGTNYTITGTSQFLSVPYALYAKTAGNNSPGPQGEQGLIGPSGSNGVSVISSNVIGDSLFITLSNGQIINSGYVRGPQGSPGVSSTFNHYLGESFGGGVIFNLWKDAQGIEHGLIVDKTDLSASQAWSNVNQVLIGPFAQSNWDGLSNSNSIVSQVGHINSAASLCLNSTNGGQSDWYLPSILELSFLWNNYFIVAKSISQIQGATQISTSIYWSSTESSSNLAWRFDFNAGGPSGFPNKSDAKYVRAIRAF